MKRVVIQIVLICLPLMMISQESDKVTVKRVTSVVDSSHVNNVVLKQSFEVNVSIDSVWNAYTTKKGWEKWATAIAEVDFKINGLIRTNYNKDGKIGDESTITLHVINYIPQRMLTLQAELNKNFPEFLKEDEKSLFNMILFEEITPIKTKVISYGIGYKNNEKYMSLLNFFIQGNEQSYLNLISYLETGKSSVNY